MIGTSYCTLHFDNLQNHVLISLCLKKDNVCADEDPEDDRKIKLMSLLEEVEVLEKVGSEMRTASVRCHCGMNRLVI